MGRKGVPVIFSAVAIIFLTSHILADWGPAKRLTRNSGGSYAPAVAAYAGAVVHAVWYDSTPYNYEIYYKRSSDGGATWGGAQRLTWNSGVSAAPAIAVDSGGAVQVVWSDNTPGNDEIYAKKSTDGGSTWSAAKRLTWNSGESDTPAMVIDSNDSIHVVWYDTTPGVSEIYYMRSVDGGTTWSAAKRLTWTSGSSGAPAIASGSGGVLFIVWEDYTPGNQEIYGLKSTNGGTSWSAVQRLTWTSTKSYSPAVALNSGNAVHVVWEDSMAGNSEIYYKRSTNGGTTWGAAKRLTWTSGNTSNAVIGAYANAVVHVVWYDEASGDYELYYKRSTNGGTTWSAGQRLTWNSGISSSPSIAVDSGGAVHLVWSDDTPGNPEVYYKKGT
jgi:BNR repeat-like domain